jgi:hypothetical protein
MPEYKVVWEIEISARTPLEAAQMALAIHRDRSSLAKTFTVKDEATGRQIEIDLEEIGERC